MKKSEKRKSAPKPHQAKRSRTPRPETVNEHGLTLKQQRFADEYLICANGTEAARRAGYRGNAVTLASVAYENLRKTQIAAYLRERLVAEAMDAEEVRWRLADQARSTLADFFDAEGEFDLQAAAKAGKLHLVKSYSKGPRGVRIELYDAQNAQIQIARMHGLLKDRLELDEPITIKLDK